MKFINNIKRLFAVLAVSAIAVSCDSDNNEGITKYPTAEEYVKAQPDCKVFLKAIMKTDLLATLRNPGSYTYFVPNDAAFAPLTEVAIDAMTTTQLADLKKVIQYHILNVGTTSADLVTNGYTKTFSPFGSSTSATLSMFVGVKEGAVKINDLAKITGADVQVSNGVIHKIDKQLVLPKLYDLIAANPKLSKFTTMLTSTAAGVYGDQTAVLNVVKGAGPLTIFAPNNDAVTKATEGAGFFTGTAVNQANATKLLQYHLSNTNQTAVSTSAWIANTAAANATITTLATPQKFEIEKGTLKIKELPTADGFALIETVNVQSTNGALHIINKVLKPALP